MKLVEVAEMLQSDNLLNLLQNMQAEQRGIRLLITIDKLRTTELSKYAKAAENWSDTTYKVKKIETARRS